MKQITKHLYQISLGSVNTFLIEDNGLTLIDTGFKNSRDKIFQAIRNGGKNPDDIKQIILTHSHPDHSGSVADIKRTLDVPSIRASGRRYTRGSGHWRKATASAVTRV
jgi:glyoxylase-like metal-dependent hydrolase (beta-lactamase superfamily II)